VVADAGMVSEANQTEIEAAGLSFILGMKIPRFLTRSPSGSEPVPCDPGSQRAIFGPDIVLLPGERARLICTTFADLIAADAQ
jgi:hypothetical protein